MTVIDKAGSQYWDENWQNVQFPVLFDENNSSLDNYVNLQLHEFFKNNLKISEENNILEIGCANSIWPIYFKQYFKAKVHGLDYSPVGCEKSRQLLKHYDVIGEIHCADLFNPPPNLQNAFDLVVSFGVVEHFENTVECLRACAAYVKPGGIIVTVIPNMAGIVGFIQKIVDKSVYDVHVPLNKKKFANAHNAAGLKITYCDYFMTMNLSVVNSGDFSKNKYNKHLRHLLSAVSKMFWWLEKYKIRIPKNGLYSPYIISMAVKE